MSLRSSLAAALLAGLACTAQADAPNYAGTLGTGNYSGSVADESGPWSTPDQWSFWQFTADFLHEVSIRVTPEDATHDVFIAVWYGLETDTANYFDMESGSLNTVFVASADAAGPFMPDGAGEPAALSFRNLYGNGPFTLAIADYVDGQGSGMLPYTITAAVPEPATLAMWLAGLAATAGSAYRRRV